MLQIEMRVKGEINPQWSEWFGGLTISRSDAEVTILAGQVRDEAALYGIISRLRDLGLRLIGLWSEEVDVENL